MISVEKKVRVNEPLLLLSVNCLHSVKSGTTESYSNTGNGVIS